MMTYIEVRDWLESFIPLVYGKEELGLSRIRNLLNLLGNPQKNFKSILVGGTAGKGSTSFYIARLLRISGSATRKYKIGLHISPHLIYIGERMQINGMPISVGRLVSLVNEIKPVVDDIKSKQPELLPSYFEILVAMSFLYFAKKKVDFAVVEVGLGGRLDATNILTSEISVITNVGLDHTELLGNTLEKISKEKAGIIKENKIIVTGATGIALKKIEKEAKNRKALLIKYSTLSVGKSLETDIENNIFSHYLRLRTRDQSFAAFNKNLALITVLALKIDLDEKVVKKAFSGEFEGRFEEIEEGMIVDGAHNADKVRALIQWIKSSQFKVHCAQKIILIVAFKKGKNWQEMIDLLIKNLPVSKIIATQYFATTDMGKGSAVDAEEIASYLTNDKRQTTNVKIIKNSQEAVVNAISYQPSAISNKTNGKSPKPKDIVLVTGSLYLVGEARTLWKLPNF
jgi:dihydrofolate synthase/folylpolyglutamate synthase